MPTAIKVISTLCILLASVFIANLLFLQKNEISVPIFGFPLFSFISLFGAASLIVIALVSLLRILRLVGFVRVLVYALLLALGLNVLLMLKYLITGYGAFTILFNLVVIVFAIGVRGYLSSPKMLQDFTGQV